MHIRTWMKIFFEGPDNILGGARAQELLLRLPMAWFRRANASAELWLVGQCLAVEPLAVCRSPKTTLTSIFLRFLY